MKFGTSGLRGLARDLEGPAARRYAAAFARHLLRSGMASTGDVILLGRDLRVSSPEIAGNCADALARMGFAVADCGAVPTPALALQGLIRNAASLIVTGSHIPADRNGIKFYRPDGEINKADEGAIGALAETMRVSGEMEGGMRAGVSSALVDESSQCLALFLERNKSLLPARALAGLKLGVYQHSTVARDLLVEVLAHYGADVCPLGRVDSFVAVDTEAVSPETLASLRGWARAHALDAIVSADGDGDRPLVADETGAPLRGDLLGLVAAQFLKAETVVTPVTSNSGIEAAGDFEVSRTRVGSPFVIAGMDEAVAAGRSRVMGFEANGGVLTATDFEVNGRTLRALPTRDSFLPILAVLSLVARQKRPLSHIAAGYRLPAAAADRIENFPSETSAALMAHLRASDSNLSAFLAPFGQVRSSSNVDGLRLTLADGRIIHLRPSGNAPEMRCYVEAETEASAEALLQAGLERIRAWADGHGAASPSGLQERP